MVQYDLIVYSRSEHKQQSMPLFIKKNCLSSLRTATKAYDYCIILKPTENVNILTFSTLLLDNIFTVKAFH